MRTSLFMSAVIIAAKMSDRVLEDTLMVIGVLTLIFCIVLDIAEIDEKVNRKRK